ncbi:uncharacterized protein TNCV_1182841 [Trichonephila clavipes]|nr:uncharacterized protein TNCV_1182841 [Trichonephila clavipes]
MFAVCGVPVSAADKGCRVYPLDPRPDAVALYSGCTPGKRRVWFLPGERHTACLVELRGWWRHARVKLFLRTYGYNAAVPGLPFDSESSKSLNSSRGVISEPDLKCTSEAEIVEGFSREGVIQTAKSSSISAATQTDENITKVKCPPLKLLQPLASLPKPNTSISTPAISTSSSSTQAQLLPSISAISPMNPIPNNDPSTSNISAFPSSSGVRPSSESFSIQDTKQKAITRLK